MATQAQYPKWPRSLPCALVEDTAADVSMAVVRTPFEGGITRQRRLHRTLTHAYSLSWLFRQTPDWGVALPWLNTHGYNWFWLELPSALAGAENKQHTQHLVRLISDLNTRLVPTREGYFWRVSATAEWYPFDAICQALVGQRITMSRWVPLNNPLADPIGGAMAGVCNN